MNWEVLGGVSPRDLVEARLAAHWAAQVVAAVGSGLVAPAPDDSHTSMRWRHDERTFFGAVTPQRFAAALRPEDLTLMLTLPTGTTLRELGLPDRTLQEARDWMQQAIAAVTGGGPGAPLGTPGYLMDEHALATGGSFPRDLPLHLAELTRWFANAASLLETIQGENEDASPVRCWPHHFDIATLVLLDNTEGAAPEQARSINVGMSPGDPIFAEPYFYVTPWPPPQDAELPPLDGAGEWNTTGWLGAVLTASDIVHVEGAALQGRAVMTHIRSSITACRKLLEEPTAGPGRR